MRECESQIQRPVDLQRFFDQYNWNIFSEFTFNSKGLSVVLTPGAIFPHAAGIHDIYLTWESLNGRVSNWFAKSVLAKIKPSVIAPPRDSRIGAGKH
jgi:hypothetical protein